MNNITTTETGRIDARLSEHVDVSRNQVQEWIRNGQVRVDGDLVMDKSYTVDQNTRITITTEPTESNPELVPDSAPLEILYEDDHLIAINKSSGIVVHPTPDQDRGTLANRLVHHYPDLRGVGETKRAGLVHRLDKGTSGVIIVARTEKSLKCLKDQFRQRSIEKTYRAVVEGDLEEETLKIDVPIKRHPHNPILRSANPAGKEAITEIKKEDSTSSISALWCYPRTGRTHQIRVHCQYIDHPIVGDDKYDQNCRDLRLILHSESIEFSHPITDNPIVIEADPPEEVMHYWNECLS